MTFIEPTKQEPDNAAFVKKNTTSIRIWHWLNTIIISGLLITVLINATILKSRKSAPLVQSEIKNSGAIVSIDQAKAAVHALSDKVWEIHVYLGFGLAVLFILRLIAEFLQPVENKFFNRLKKSRQLYARHKETTARHELIVKVIYIAFYLLLTIMVITGLTLAFGEDVILLKPYLHTIKDIHGFCMYLILAFVVVHVAGVVIAEHKNGKGIVSDMINGG